MEAGDAWNVKGIPASAENTWHEADLSAPAFSSLEEAVECLFGKDRKIARRQSVSGGDINDAYALTLDDGQIVFMKTNAVSALPSFQAEARGLTEIANTRTFGTPQILGLGKDPEGFSFLLLSHIRSGTNIRNYWEEFGRDLARMHSFDLPEGTKYGFEENNFIGQRRQLNTPHETWIGFFRECRLEVQFRDAGRYFDAEDRKRIKRLLDHLDEYLTEPEKPRLVHGDLWAGNFMTGEDGRAWLIDPAAYCGHPEVDIAMTELFGGFSPRFYDAYQEVLPPEPGLEDRLEIYNLYQLLNHLNMFGGAYLPAVCRTLRRYGG